MSDEAVETDETINVWFDRREHSVSDFEDGSAYTDHNDDPIMWSWEFTRRSHWYQLVSDLLLVAESCDDEEKPIPEHIRYIYTALFDAYRVDATLLNGDIMEKPHVVRARLLLLMMDTPVAGDFRANWRKPGYWQYSEGPPDDVHRPHIRSHQSTRGPWATGWPGLDEALALADDPEEHLTLVPVTYYKALARGVTVGGGDSLNTRGDYVCRIEKDPEMSKRLAHFAFDLSLPIEWQLNAVRKELVFMQKKALQHGFVDEVSRAEALPGMNGVLMLRCLDADADRRNPNDSQIMRAFGWNPASDRTRFKRLRKRAQAFRDNLAPKLCELRT